MPAIQVALFVRDRSAGRGIGSYRLQQPYRIPITLLRTKDLNGRDLSFPMSIYAMRCSESGKRCVGACCRAERVSLWQPPSNRQGRYRHASPIQNWTALTCSRCLALQKEVTNYCTILLTVVAPHVQSPDRRIFHKYPT